MLKAKLIQKLIVHCSDTPDDCNFDAIYIHKMHLSFGWDGIGYHKVILRNGEVEEGRPEYWVGAHVKGLNDQSLGVCLIGRKHFTKKQFDALDHILRKWKKKYANAIILGHYQATDTNKTCPNFDVKTWCLQRGIF